MIASGPSALSFGMIVDCLVWCETQAPAQQVASRSLGRAKRKMVGGAKGLRAQGSGLRAKGKG